jgi:hypothetical protein
MLPDMVPASLMTPLAAFAPLFTAPSFRTFAGLACGFLAQPGKRTVCGMLPGAGLSRLRPHDRAHRFFSRARWNAGDLGLAAAVLLVSLLVPAGAPVDVAVDDTLFRRRGKKARAASRFHDGPAPGPAKTGYGNNWVVLGIVVRLRLTSRPVAVPAMAKPAIKGTNSKSRLRPARGMAERPAAALPGRAVRVVADPAYAGGELKDPPAAISWTTRPRKDAALHGLPPARTGRPGRPRVKGDRLPSLAELAAAAEFSQVTVPRYGRTETIGAAVATCLRHSVFGSLPVTVVIVRDKPGSGSGIALVTTDRTTTAGQAIERYASRWPIEIAIEDAKQIFGTGQARNRTAAAVERTVPFQIAFQAVAVTWHATAGHDPADVRERRSPAPWHTSKAEPATADMAAKLRRVIITARFKASRPHQPAPQEISLLRLAWEDTAPLAA